MHRGYVKLWRRSLDSELIKNHKLWAFWCWCLMRASHKEKEVVIGLKSVSLVPGQFVFGRKKAAAELGIPESTIYSFIKFLKTHRMLTAKASNKFSIITIIKWATYQSDDCRVQQQTSNKLATNQQQTSTNKNVKHYKHEKHLKNKKKTPLSSQRPAEPVIVLKPENPNLFERYSEHDIGLITDALKAIATTRKHGKISDNVRDAILMKWDSVSVEKVISGIKLYLDKGYHVDGKDEKYLWGIIRNQEPPPAQKSEFVRSGAIGNIGASTLIKVKEMMNEQA